MSISVPSRFACLSLEEEQTNSQPEKCKQTKKLQKTKKVNNITSKISAKPSSGRKTRQKARQEEDQWEAWKKKDDELVNDHFEEELKSALLESKVEFEKNKTVITTEEKSVKKKKKTMSLDEFLCEKKEQKTVVVNEGNFFEDFLNVAHKEIKKEQVERKRKEREANIDEIITLAQCQEKLNCERLKNEKLVKELEEARNEICAVKKRNTTLYKMLSQGEMKDKAAVLLELERLTNVKEELSEEVNRLHKLLEQERSNKSLNTNESLHSKHKHQKKKQ